MTLLCRSRRSILPSNLTHRGKERQYQIARGVRLRAQIRATAQHPHAPGLRGVHSPRIPMRVNA
jgi:hypothetical protein